MKQFKPEAAQVTPNVRKIAQSLETASNEIALSSRQLIVDPEQASADPSELKRERLIENHLEKLMRDRIRNGDPDWSDVQTPSSRFSIVVQERDALKIFLSEALGPDLQDVLEDAWEEISGGTDGDIELILNSMLGSSLRRSGGPWKLSKLLNEYDAWSEPLDFLNELRGRAALVRGIRNCRVPDGLREEYASDALIHLSFLPSDRWISGLVHFLMDRHVSKRFGLFEEKSFFNDFVPWVMTGFVGSGVSSRLGDEVMRFVENAINGRLVEEIPKVRLRRLIGRNCRERYFLVE